MQALLLRIRGQFWRGPTASEDGKSVPSSRKTRVEYKRLHLSPWNFQKGLPLGLLFPPSNHRPVSSPLTFLPLSSTFTITQSHFTWFLRDSGVRIAMEASHSLGHFRIKTGPARRSFEILNNSSSRIRCTPAVILHFRTLHLHQSYDSAARPSLLDSL